MLIIHGDDIKKSYDHLQQVLESYKSNDFEISSHNASELDITQLRQESDNQDLFARKKVIVLNGFLSLSKLKSKDGIIKILNSLKDQEVVLYEQKEITATGLKPFITAKKDIFKLNPIIFKLMDSIRPGNQKSLLKMYKDTISTGIEPEYIYAMLVRQVRLLIQAKYNPNAIKIAPFAKRLFQAQAQYFDSEKLLDLHHQLYLIDKKIKQGTSAAETEHLIFHFFQSV